MQPELAEIVFSCQITRAVVGGIRDGKPEFLVIDVDSPECGALTQLALSRRYVIVGHFGYTPGQTIQVRLDPESGIYGGLVMSHALFSFAQALDPQPKHVHAAELAELERLFRLPDMRGGHA